MLLKKAITSSVALLACAMCAQAQDSTKSLTISGSVDAYYRFNSGKNDPNSKTSFTSAANSFELGMASIRADATALSGKVTGTVDLGFGNRAKEFSYNDNGNNGLQYIKQAYVTYAPSSALKFTAGKFGTHVGYEVLDPFANRNYSMSYMFTNGPFFHTGLKADITAGKVGFMVGVANHVDHSTGDGYGIKDLLAQFSVAPNDKWKIYLNYWGFFGAKSFASTNGSQSTSQIDLVVLGTITDKFSLGINGTLQSLKLDAGDSKTKSKSWYGAALYLNYDPISALGITLRGEYIGDKDMIKYVYNTVGAKNIFQSTLSFDYKVGPVTIIPELRIDNAKNEIFVKNDGTATKSTFSALVAAVYRF